MHILLGAYLLSGRPGYRQAGIHQYSRALLEEFGAASFQPVLPGGTELSFTALVSPSARDQLPVASRQSSVVSRQSPVVSRQSPVVSLLSPISYLFASRSTENPFSRMWVEQVETPRVARRIASAGCPCLYHGLAFVAPLRAPCPTVVTVHDLSFLTQPQTHKRFNRIYLAWFTRWSCRRAARVIAVSAWTKRDVVALLGVDPGRVDVIPHGVHPRFKPLPPDEVAAFRRAKGIGDQAIFFLGSLEPRKNLVALIDAFALMSGQPSAIGGQLIVGGAPGWKYEAIFERVRALGLEGRVRFEGHMPHQDLPRWYNACAVFAYPSLYEGFGMPVLEAMACGAPVVTSDVTSLPEVVGDAGILVAPRDVEALAQALMRVLTDARLRADLSQRARIRAVQFSWRRAAELTVRTYRTVMDDQPVSPTR